MSHYLNIETQITDQDALIRALNRMEYKGGVSLGKVKIESHITAQNLYGYHGDMRQDKAQVIIRRNYVGPSSNDIGFIKNAKGNFQAIISEYDRNSLNYNDQWVAKLGTYYGVEKMKMECESKGQKYFEDTDEKNRPRFRMPISGAYGAGGGAYAT